MLKIKIKQNTGYPNKKYTAIIEHIHQNIRITPEVKKKKFALINDWENIIAYWEASEQREV